MATAQEQTGNFRTRRPSQDRTAAGAAARERLMADLPVTERRLTLNGIPTAVVEGGSGPAILLLHGPGESALNWLRVIPGLVENHRVIAPDLPAHGASSTGDGALDPERVLGWLDDLIECTCLSPPVAVGHILGGAIAARFAIRHAERLQRLVLVDSLGLAPFRPAAGFAFTMLAFMLRPSEHSYVRFMRHCSYDLDRLREQMGARWDAFTAYNVALARAPASKAAGRLVRTLGFPRIPPQELARIAVPTALIWGRHDRANALAIAERAHERFGWPLHVIEDCADDPPRDQPGAFLQALYSATTDSPTRARLADAGKEVL